MCFFWKKKKKQQSEQVAKVEEQKAVSAKPVEEKAEEQSQVVEQPIVQEEVVVEQEVVEENDTQEEAQETTAETAKKAKTERRGKFVYRKTDKGNYVYKLYSSNHRVIAIGGEPYSSLASMKIGINSIIKNAASAPIEDQTLQNVVEQKCPKWELFVDAKGEYRFRLKASNGNIVCVPNDGYISKDACKNGMKSVAKTAATADIVADEEK